MTPKTLTLADDLSLPADEAVTQKYGFIGRSGSGKSYAAMKLAELFLGAGAQVIALDWVGIWWSLRLNADGKRPGFEHVYIFGGEHADVDLRPESGALMADLVVDKHISVVLDVMHFRKAERTRFATAFAEQFFHRKKTARTACHLFIEEAQAYLPQMVRGDEARMVGVFEDIGKVGRNYGIGNSLISQRPQAINKDVLNQIEVLLAFQTNGPQERKAIAGWTAENTTVGAAMMQALPTLPVGDALVWSPQWLRLATRVHIAARDTYNSSRTPTGQPKTIAPKTLAKADLEQLGEEIKATIEKAKADDPKELKKLLAQASKGAAVSAKRISELESRVSKTSGFAHSDEGKKQEVAVLTDADRELLRTLGAEFKAFSDDIGARADAQLAALADRAKAAIDEAAQRWTADVDKRRELFAKRLEQTRVQRAIDKLERVAPAGVANAGNIITSSRHAAPTSPPHVRQSVENRPIRQAIRQVAPPRSSNPDRPAGEGGDLTRGERAVLTAIAQSNGATREQITVLTGYRRSTRDLYLQQLGRRGAVDASRNDIIATDAGMALLGPGFEPLPTGRDLIAYWQARLPQGERAVFDVLVEAEGAPVDRGDLSERTGYKRSTRDLYNQLLQRRKIAYADRAGVRASPELFAS